jgi:hypothetical protein
MKVFSGQIFENYPDIKRHENPSGKSRVTTRKTEGQEGQKQTDRHDLLFTIL